MTSRCTRLFLVRHGATVLAAEDRFAGSTETPLSEEGRGQASRLAERLARESIAAIFSSPLGRAVETARILAVPHRLEVQTRPELREIAHGHWEQLTRREVEERFPDEAAAWDQDPFTFAPAGGENGLMVTARALPALIEIVRAHAGLKVLVVSHKATIRLLLSSLLGFDPRRYRDNLDQIPLPSTSWTSSTPRMGGSRCSMTPRTIPRTGFPFRKNLPNACHAGGMSRGGRERRQEARRRGSLTVWTIIAPLVMEWSAAR